MQFGRLLVAGPYGMILRLLKIWIDASVIIIVLKDFGEAGIEALTNG